MPTHRELANAIRALSMDAVQRANSGHPGMPMGMADIAEVLWRDFLKHNPADPQWWNRDRFVLSNGHGAMLHYALLHLSGYDLTIDDLKNFRQMHSKTPGHPEFHEAPGIETTTGPLGQGIANAVGMALAEKLLAKNFNQDDIQLIDHHTYVFLGDGCLMEGVSHEACSIAGTLKLGKLIAFYDDNGISIDGEVEGWFTDDTPKRFEAYQWHVIPNVDGHDHEAIKKAIVEAQNVTDKPTLICCKTVIGYGSPNLAGTETSHGSPLGDEEISATRKALEWSHAPFEIPEEIYNAWNARKQGGTRQQEWSAAWEKYQTEHPKLAKELQRRMEKHLPENFETLVNDALSAMANEKPIATRKSSQACLNALAPHCPELLGGSADLTGSNGTQWKEAKIINAHDNGNYLHYGVREFGMSAIMNGIALHGGFIPFGGTFLTFSDYARNAVRLSALMKQRVIYVYTHDSIGLGEDGPTHQPIEHIASLRLIPNLMLWRPCDAIETLIAWEQSLKYAGPTCLLLTRQNLAQQTRTAAQIEGIRRGAYVLIDCDETPNIIFIATGSEVELAVLAAQNLKKQGKQVRVVSMPSMKKFAEQDRAYQEKILPSHVKSRIAIEAGVAESWYRWVGPCGKIIALNTFGASAPANQLFEYFGFTVENIVQETLTLLSETLIEE
ncbi:MAG: transketolase [Gammaproteobacteria bacterium]